ncbi:4-hydroxy-3-methylbut-2-enyl diphosphate reductase [Sellimonas sp.]|uniref:4-hydroxy-3-methylbut-2-enyl diphosphate reductase n=1 Tax=Sellimonas sp. TaxID=2021466 RepID=UPI00257D1F1B|nr:4-hydroxy-3-methylbut-2-enyl diphosphate reductase [Sellimonas sp.]
MEIRLAKTAGFCFGVKRAVDAVYEQVEKRQKRLEAGEAHVPEIYTFGPIIHNEEVVKDLEKKGVGVLHTEEDLDRLDDGIVIIRSHGVGKQIYDKLEEKGIPYVDTTCPFVKKIHNIVQKESDNGKYIIIIGNKEHPEVKGIKGWAKDRVSVIESEEEAKAFTLENSLSEAENGNKICIVSQTTFNYNKFKYLVEILLKTRYDISVLNTICNATKERQTEASHIAAEVDAMIVIGDKHSSNTQKLFEICEKACKNTYYIQTLDDLNMNQLQLKSVEAVGITAGASTPNNIIEEVQNNVRLNF